MGEKAFTFDRVITPLSFVEDKRKRVSVQTPADSSVPNPG